MENYIPLTTAGHPVDLDTKLGAIENHEITFTKKGSYYKTENQPRFFLFFAHIFFKAQKLFFPKFSEAPLAHYP